MEDEQAGNPGLSSGSPPRSGSSSRRHGRAGAQRMTRSCDSCRRRKVRCDAKEPSCANCKSIGVVCQTLRPQGKRGRKAIGNTELHANARPIAEFQTNDKTSSPVTLDTSSNRQTESAGTPRFDPSFSGSPHCSHASQPQRANIARSHPSDRANSGGLSPVPAAQNHADQYVASPSLSNQSFWHAHLDPGLADIAADLIAAGVTEAPTSYMGACINLFFENIYPTYPVLYRPAIDLALSDLEGQDKVWDWKSFTLITASCAFTLAVLPTSVSNVTRRVAEIFYQASKNGLDSYAEEDIENPDYTSIVIRMFHSGWIHASGKSRPSWFVLGECIRICQLMRLHDERSYENMPYVEAQLCRRAFWTLYTGDKSAAVLGGNPICLKSDLFSEGITVTYPDHMPGQDEIEITTAKGDKKQMSIMDGFHANQTLWRSAEPLLVAGLGDSQANRDFSSLIEAYVGFRTCLDDVPSVLRVYNSLEMSVSEFTFADRASHLRVPRTIAIQRINLQVSFYCLRMVILRKVPGLFHNRFLDRSGDLRLFEGGEKSSSSSGSITISYMLEALQIAEDLLAFIHMSTLELIRLNGEACAEKIRLVGAAILELMAYDPSRLLIDRASKYLELYPHILAMLDSKASDVAEYAVMS
ncbi:hypothetical protein BKA63DRAFT_494997 [Paraphoma chrysanthemicola]|nr:hypothetical protein BKA63DRAFT_494997 [Paraphoma chrysanthemicola]